MKKLNLIILISLIILSIQTAYAGDFTENSMDFFDNPNAEYSMGPENTLGLPIFTNEAKVIKKKNGKSKSWFRPLSIKKKSKKNKNDNSIMPEVIDYDYDVDKEEIIPVVNETVQENYEETPQPEQKIEKKDKKAKKVYNDLNSDIVVYCDNMDYLQDKQEIVGTGNVKVVFSENNSVLTAEKIVYNHDLNYIEGIDNVKMIKNGLSMDGDYAKLDLNYGNVLVDNPVIDNYQIKIVAKKSNITSDSLEAYDGVATTTNDYERHVYSPQHSAVFPMDINSDMYRRFYPKEYRKKGSKYHIKTNTLYVNSTEGHDTLTFKNADIYLGKVLLYKGANLTLSTDKTQSYVETTIPEIGTMRYVGAYFAPGIVLNLPKSSTLKLAPLINIYEGSFGVGVMARLRNRRNLTTLMYSTSSNELVLSGRQRLGDSDFFLEYARKAYMNDWFIGSNISEYLAQLVYEKRYYNQSTGTSYTHRATAGYLTDEFGNTGTARFRYMAMLYQNLAEYKNYDKKLYASLGIVTQGMMGVYGTGDVTGAFRIGPTLRTQYRGWGQTISFFQSAKAGASPLKNTDDYHYGNATVNLLENLRLNKYVSLGFLVTLNLSNNDPRGHNMFSESRVMISLGPEDAKISFGYDMLRQGTMLSYSALIGSKNQDIKFKKLFMKNPNKLAQENKKTKKARKPFTVYPTPDEMLNNQQEDDSKEEESKNDEPKETHDVMESPFIFNFGGFGF